MQTLLARRRTLVLSADPWLWGGFACVWAVSTLWCRAEQISISCSGVMLGLAAMFMAAACSVRALFPGAASVSVLCEGIAAYGMFPVAFAPLSYAVVRSPFPAIDPALRAADMLLGFDSAQWRGVVLASPVLCWLQGIAYASYLPQCFLALFVLPQVGAGRRGFMLLRAAGLSLAAICALCFFFPAVGTTPSAESWLADWQTLHDTAAPLSASQVDGIITFPSFHACLAVLLTRAMRGLGPLSWGVAMLNAAMLFATPAIGCHYLVDVVAGMGVGGLAVLAVQALDRQDWPLQTA